MFGLCVFFLSLDIYCIKGNLLPQHTMPSYDDYWSDASLSEDSSEEEEEPEEEPIQTFPDNS